MEINQLSRRLEIAVRVAREAGDLTLDYFGIPDLRIDTKSDQSPVTEADRLAEQLIRKRVSEEFPDDGFLGEEYGDTPGQSTSRWILDPIDGTKSFVRGVPLFGTLIGLETEQEMVAGVIYMPALHEMVFAAKGLGAWWIPGSVQQERSPGALACQNPPMDRLPWIESLDAIPARVSNVDTLAQAMFCTTSSSYFDQIGRLELFEKLRSSVALERGWSDCYAHLLVATGRADFAVDPAMHVWDHAAIKPIIEEAGGVFTDLEGNTTIYGESAVSINGCLHHQIMDVIRRY